MATGDRWDALLAATRFAQAVDLARAGHYSAAENLLGSMPQDDSTSPMRLDLMARMRAQQGRLREADALWGQAALLVPDREAFRAGPSRIARLQARPASVARVLIGLAVLMTLALVTALMWRMTRQLDSLRSTVIALSDRPYTGAPGSPSSASDLEAQLTLPGISFRRQQNALVVRFDAGLFVRGTVLSASAARLLTELGQRLEASAGRRSVEIIGSTDDVPVPAHGRYRDNSELGLARAVAVVEHLREATRLPERTLLVRAGGEANAPYPNDSPANRARNRTVTMRILPAP
jgi:flagellar motor protein MotB